MTLTANYNDSPSLLVHAPQQKEGEEPVAKIVCGKGSVESIVRPRLITKVLKASIEDKGTDRRDLALGNPSLRRVLSTPGNLNQYLKFSYQCNREEHSAELWVIGLMELTLISSATLRTPSSFVRSRARTSYECAVPCASTEESAGACPASRTV